MRFVHLLLSFLCLYLLSACANNTALEVYNRAQPDIAAIKALPDSTWQLAALHGKGAEQANITLTFDDSVARGSAGCNLYAGQYRSDRARIRFFKTMRTVTTCKNKVLMAQENSYLQALKHSVRYRVFANTLHLQNGAGQTLLVFKADF